MLNWIYWDRYGLRAPLHREKGRPR